MDYFKELIWDTLVNQALNLLFAKIPFLSLGPIKAIVIYFVKKYAEILYSILKTIVDLNRIFIKNEALEKEFLDSSVKLKIIAQGEGIESEAFRKARNEHKKKLSDLGRFSANPSVSVH